MVENDKPPIGKMTEFDPAFHSELPGFERGRMVSCDRCERQNPPNRLACLYCGAALPIESLDTELPLARQRKLDAWEPGHNLILRTVESTVDIPKAARILGLEIDSLNPILDASRPLPIARLESESAADAVANLLAEAGIRCVIVSDTALADDYAPRRLRNITLSGDDLILTLFNTHVSNSFSTLDLLLMITGVITKSSSDQVEKKGLRGSSKVLEESSTVTDEPILDLYFRDDPIGFRVQSTGFDFSCLDAEKSLLSELNLKKLAAKILHLAPNARMIDDYKKVRPQLGSIWEIESREDRKGLRHSRFGKKGFGTVASTSNLRQFTKFSRMHFHLL